MTQETHISVDALRLRDPAVMKPVLDIVEGFVQMVCPTQEIGRWVFRGISSAKHKLAPSIGREFAEGDDAKCRIQEKEYYERFTKLALMHLSADELILMREGATQMGDEPYAVAPTGRRLPSFGQERIWLALMQHYGVPTRLLDWSESPWIGLYFACLNHPNDTGIIYALDRIELRSATATRDAGLPIRLYDAIEKPREDLIQVVEVPDAFRRIANQLGLFTITDSPLFDHEPLLRRRLSPGGFQQFIVNPSAKGILWRLLLSMNIRSSTVFPGLEGLAQTIKQEFGR